MDEQRDEIARVYNLCLALRLAFEQQSKEAAAVQDERDELHAELGAALARRAEVLEEVDGLRERLRVAEGEGKAADEKLMAGAERHSRELQEERGVTAAARAQAEELRVEYERLRVTERSLSGVVDELERGTHREEGKERKEREDKEELARRSRRAEEMHEELGRASKANLRLSKHNVQLSYDLALCRAQMDEEKQRGDVLEKKLEEEGLRREALARQYEEMMRREEKLRGGENRRWAG